MFDGCINVLFIFMLFQVEKTLNNIALKCNVGKKSNKSMSNTNQKGTGSLAAIIPDWPKLKSFDRTKKKKEVTTLR